MKKAILLGFCLIFILSGISVVAYAGESQNSFTPNSLSVAEQLFGMDEEDYKYIAENFGEENAKKIISAKYIFCINGIIAIICLIFIIVFSVLNARLFKKLKKYEKDRKTKELNYILYGGKHGADKHVSSHTEHSEGGDEQ